MGKVIALTGCEASAEAMRQIDPDVVPAYPITPSSEIMEVFARMRAEGRVQGELLLVESEHSAMSACVGASAAGARVMTATDAQGLAYMWEVLPIASGMRLPIVMSLCNRALSVPANIHCDHSDSMGSRDNSWVQIYCETAQEVYENTLLAIRLAEDPRVLLPVMVCQDGFLTSGNVVGVEIFSDKKVRGFVGEYKPKRQTLLDIDKPSAYGMIKAHDSYYETRMQQVEAMEKARKAFIEIGKELSKITGRGYGFLEEYKTRDAQAVVIVMSATAGTAKQVVEDMRKEGKKVGLIKINLFRPFPYRELERALKGINMIAVMDRSESYGGGAPLYLEVLKSIQGSGKRVQSYVFGLGGRYVYEHDIRGVFDDLLKGRVTKETKHIGVR